MKKLLLSFLLPLLYLQGFSQIELVSTTPLIASSFYADHLENIYSIEGNTLTKYWFSNKKTNIYSSKLYGDITFVDVRNPMQILLFYADIMQMVILDNTLSLQKTIALENYELEQVSLACTSTNNSYWVYDQESAQLIRFDSNMKRIQETGNLIQLFDRELNPDFLTEVNNKIYLHDPGTGVFVFDIYGTYIKIIPIKPLKDIFINGGIMLYTKKDIPYVFQIKSGGERKIDFPTSTYKKLQFQRGKFYLLTDKELLKYTIK